MKMTSINHRIFSTTRVAILLNCVTPITGLAGCDNGEATAVTDGADAEAVAAYKAEMEKQGDGFAPPKK